MKKFLIIVLAAMASVSAMAQDGFERTFTIGVGPKVGVNLASMTAPTGFNLNPSSAAGFEGGLMVNAHFGKRSEFSQGGTGWIGIQAEALFSQRSVSTSIGKDISLTGLSVPVLLHVYPMPNLYIGVGPTFAATFTSSPDELVEGSKHLDFSSIKPFDVMLTVGVGYQFINDKSRGGFTIDARYNMGTSQMDTNFDSKMSHISVSVGYLFNLVK